MIRRPELEIPTSAITFVASKAVEVGDIAWGGGKRAKDSALRHPNTGWRQEVSNSYVCYIYTPSYKRELAQSTCPLIF